MVVVSSNGSPWTARRAAASRLACDGGLDVLRRSDWNVGHVLAGDGGAKLVGLVPGSVRPVAGEVHLGAFDHVARLSAFDSRWGTIPQRSSVDSMDRESPRGRTESNGARLVAWPTARCAGDAVRRAAEHFPALVEGAWVTNSSSIAFQVDTIDLVGDELQHQAYSPPDGPDIPRPSLTPPKNHRQPGPASTTTTNSRQHRVDQQSPSSLRSTPGGVWLRLLGPFRTPLPPVARCPR